MNIENVIKRFDQIEKDEKKLAMIMDNYSEFCSLSSAKWTLCNDNLSDLLECLKEALIFVGMVKVGGNATLTKEVRRFSEKWCSE